MAGGDVSFRNIFNVAAPALLLNGKLETWCSCATFHAPLEISKYSSYFTHAQLPRPWS